MKKLLAELDFFTGFYESIHSSAFDSEIEQIIEENNCSYDDLEYNCDFINYSKEYVNAVNSITKLNLEFESLDSPKYYNYTTDRIFVYINEADFTTILQAYNSNYALKLQLAKKVKSKFTSRDGFSSFYSNSIREWLQTSISEWDHNQLGLLLSVYCEFTYSDGIWNDDYNIDIAAWEYACGNGAAMIDYTINKKA